MTALREHLERDVIPQADAWDHAQRIPREAVHALAGHGLFGAVIEQANGGSAFAPLAWGEALEAIGEASMSLLSVLTVHTMCAHAIERWGEAEQKAAWLPALASGAKLGAFALTEPATGSDARNVETQLEDGGDHWRVTGRKRWISAAQIADVFLVFGKTAAGPTAILVPRESAGLSIMPIDGMLGFRAAQLGELVFDNVAVPKNLTIGREGMGFSHVANLALDAGRFCIACGCTGLIRACVRASVDYARARHQFGVALRAHQMIQTMLAEMTTAHKAARALWRHAATLRADSDPASITETTIAKYFASTAASRAANDAVQIHGANGCGPDYPVQRFFRDARIGEIIEGSNQMQQILIAHEACREYAARPRKATS